MSGQVQVDQEEADGFRLPVQQRRTLEAGQGHGHHHHRTHRWQGSTSAHLCKCKSLVNLKGYIKG